jgi:hypothetical protein
MSKKTILALAVCAIAFPSAARAQIGVGVRAGTLGIGGEVAIALGSHLAIRGGVGATGYHYDGTYDNKNFKVDLPPTIFNIGLDFYPGIGGLHASVGMLNRKKFDFVGAFTQSATIGGQTYQGDITLTGNMTNERETAPYVSVGFGRTTKTGIGFSLDLGAASMGKGTVTFTDYTCQSGTTNCKSQIPQARVDEEAAIVSSDLEGWLKWHPILSASLHFGLGS